MRFALLMTWRELRASWRRLVFFVLCLGLGVGAIVTLRSAIANVNAFTIRESRTINGGDIVLRYSRVPPPETAAAIETLLASDGVLARSDTISVGTMMRPVAMDVSTARIVEVKAVGPAYPVYGVLVLAGGQPYDYGMLENGGALVTTGVAAQLELDTGSVVRLGDAEFTVRGLIELEPDSGMNPFVSGSRVIVARDGLERAGVLGFSARVSRGVQLRIDESRYGELLEALRQTARGQFITVLGFRETEAGINRQLAAAADYLSLVGLAILVLGGVGIWSVTRVYIGQRWRSIAILKCLGCTNAQAIGAYTMQMAVIGLIGGLAGVAVAWAVLATVAARLATGVLEGVDVGLSPGAVVQGLAVGELVAVLFSLSPLLGIRDVRPNLVLRSDDPGRAARWNRTRVAATVLVGLGLVGMTAWQAGSWRIGAIFLGGLLLTAAACALAGEALVRVVHRARGVPVFALRHAILGLSRPGNQTRAILVAMGLGVFFLVGSAGVQTSVQNTFSDMSRPDQPDMFFLDVQPDQIGDVTSMIVRAVDREPRLVLTLAVRVAEADGTPVDTETTGDPRERSRLIRVYSLAQKPSLEAFETVVAGAWWNSSVPDGPEISIDERIAEDYRLGVGGTMTFDIQGDQLTARVTSIRHIDWQRARPGFMIVARPGTFEEQPFVAVGSVKGPAEQRDRGRLIREIVDVHSNVTIIDLRDVLATANRVVSSVSLAVSIIGAIVLGAGALILAGSIAMARYVREYETAVMKTLGARMGTVFAVLLTEHALLGLLSGAIGSSLGIGLAWIVSSQVLNLAWRFDPVAPLFGLVGSVVLAAVVGAGSSVDLVFVRPLRVLRRSEVA